MPRKNNKYHLNNANLHAAPLIQIQNHSQFKYVFKKGMDANIRLHLDPCLPSPFPVSPAHVMTKLPVSSMGSMSTIFKQDF